MGRSVAGYAAVLAVLTIAGAARVQGIELETAGTDVQIETFPNMTIELAELVIVGPTVEGRKLQATTQDAQCAAYGSKIDVSLSALGWPVEQAKNLVVEGCYPMQGPGPSPVYVNVRNKDYKAAGIYSWTPVGRGWASSLVTILPGKVNMMSDNATGTTVFEGYWNGSTSIYQGKHLAANASVEWYMCENNTCVPTGVILYNATGKYFPTNVSSFGYYPEAINWDSSPDGRYFVTTYTLNKTDDLYFDPKTWNMTLTDRWTGNVVDLMHGKGSIFSSYGFVTAANKTEVGAISVSNTGVVYLLLVNDVNTYLVYSPQHGWKEMDSRAGWYYFPTNDPYMDVDDTGDLWVTYRMKDKGDVCVNAVWYGKAVPGKPWHMCWWELTQTYCSLYGKSDLVVDDFKSRMKPGSMNTGWMYLHRNPYRTDNTSLWQPAVFKVTVEKTY